VSSADAGSAEHAQTRDPFAPIEASPRGAGVLVAIAALLGLAALLGGLSPLTGPVGMLVGLVAHVKGHRYGMPVTVAVGLMMIAGMTITLYLR
jgi:hypothetical protein